MAPNTLATVPFRIPPIIRLVPLPNLKIDVTFKGASVRRNRPMNISLEVISAILGVIKQASRARTKTG